MSLLTKTLAAGVVGAAVLVGAPVTASAAAKVTFALPSPSGYHQVGTRTLHLVDGNRADPWKPDRKRELMVDVWYPADDAWRHPKAKWLPDGLVSEIEDFAAAPPANVPKGSVDWAGARSSGHRDAPVERGKRPVVLYSPGFGGPRAVGTTAVQDLASHGYVVVTIDHTYETTVEFPGGRVEKNVTIPWEQMGTALAARVADTRFVLDELGKQRWLDGSADLRRVGMFGHSYGGFTAGEAMLRDRRIDAGVNMDGSMFPEFGEVAKQGLDRPFFLMGGQFDMPDGSVVDHSPFTSFDASWGQFWANQKGPKRSVVYTGARHHSFSDLQPILPQLVKPLGFPADHFKPFVGTIDPRHSVRAQNSDIRRFFERHL
ncbi:alpha/beta hydrolase family protein [Kibdelosporangium phytohabitans]|uniref:alpha/beta hydrolase family protein n=1 Tax=Kibdelosporangium phytohabitans TaxID=860235 RepID=UPI0009F98736|nr:hypothetical protein [Kibdelosporangium phytohabitans]MBE1464780.1 putative dienelactone hydrolase [Kibdelosporangium phytohabitans]